MEKSEFHVLIKHYFLRGKTLSETKAKLDKYYSDSAPLYGMVQKWFTEFRCGCTSTKIIPSPGRQNEITTPEMINKIHDIVLNDRKLKVREIAEIVSISTERLVNSFFMMTMHHLTHRRLHTQKSMNWVSNRFRIRRILQTWPPATIICFQTSRDCCMVGVLSLRKKMNKKQKSILEGLTNRIIWKAWKSWKIVRLVVSS